MTGLQARRPRPHRSDLCGRGRFFESVWSREVFFDAHAVRENKCVPDLRLRARTLWGF